MPFTDNKASQPPHQPFESIFGLNSSSHHEEIIGYFSLEKRDLKFSEEANALMLCTEYLGFESCDIKMSDKEVENAMMCHVEDETERVERKRRKTEEKVEKKEFPPLISSLNSRGQRSFYLRSVRDEGRLKLTQVMINQPEIFHVSRENGRLRLHLLDSVTRKDDICDVNLQCVAKEVEELEEEPKGLDRPNFEFCKDINDASDQLGDNDDEVAHIDDTQDAKKWRYNNCYKIVASMNHDEKDYQVVDNDDEVEHMDDTHDAEEWRYKSCYNIVASMNHDEKDYHHHIHPYHHYNSNNNMHLWSRSYVKTW